jgi:hypothetical protein
VAFNAFDLTRAIWFLWLQAIRRFRKPYLGTASRGLISSMQTPEGIGFYGSRRACDVACSHLADMPTGSTLFRT